MDTRHEQGDGHIPSALDFLYLAVWCGLAIGLVEVCWQLSKKLFGEDWYLFLSRDFLWMAPITQLAVFTLPGLFFFLLAWWKPRCNLAGVTLFLFSGLVVFQILLLVGHIYLWAMYVLAVGVAYQTARALKPRWGHVRRLTRRTTPYLTGAVVCLAFLALGPPLYREHRAAAQLPPPAPQNPNVLFIVLDTVSARHLSLYGYHRSTTPAMDRHAKEGVWFRHALAPAPWTLPSHACLFTGHYPHELSVGWDKPLGTGCPTLAEVFHDRGYLTAGFSANTYFGSYETGLDRGFVHYEDYGWTCGDFAASTTLGLTAAWSDPLRSGLSFYDIPGRKYAENINRNFLNWLAEQPGNRPFFAFLNYVDAHDPYLPLPPFNTQFGPPLTAEEKYLMSKWIPLVKQDLEQKYVDLAVRAYDSCLAYLDHHIGRLLDELARKGLLDDTLVIITGDHGEQFGEHQVFTHGNSLYRQVLHVPMILRFPGRIPAGISVEQPVSLRDVPATITDLAGVKGPFPGVSLASCWEGEGDGPVRAKPSPIICSVRQAPERFAKPDHGRSPLGAGPLLSLVHEGKYYIRNLADGSEEVYDFHGDPQDRNNLADSPEGQAAATRCRAELRRLLEQSPDRQVKK